MSHVIILARTTAEGNAYVKANRADLPAGRHIVPTSAAQIDGVLPHLVIELPGFRDRRDRHAILATVKRSSKKYQACEWRVLGDEKPVVDFGKVLRIPQAKPQWLRDLEDAGIIEPEGWEPPAELDARQILELAAAPAGETGAATLSRVDQMRAMADEPSVTERQVPALERGMPHNLVAQISEKSPKARRRSKCKDCGDLHFPEDGHRADYDPFDLG